MSWQDGRGNGRHAVSMNTAPMHTAPMHTAPMHTVAALVIGLVTLLIGALLAPNAEAVAFRPDVLVPEQPRLGLPSVLDGEVHAHAQIGTRIIVGGRFDRVGLPDGTVITQPNLFAYDINTGAIDTGFAPVVDGKVFDIAVSPDQSALYIGGSFTHIDGIFRGRLAKLTPAGVLVAAFRANANAAVYGIAATDSHVYAGGYFNRLGGQVRRGLGAVDATSGAVDTGFVMNLAEPLRSERAWGQEVLLSPDGATLFSVHNARLVNGATRAGVAKIDIRGATAVLTNWGSDLYATAPCVAITDGAISPDGSFIVVSSWGTDRPPGCDTVARFDTAGDATSPPRWIARMYSSVFSVAVSDRVVYVAGHFCAAPRHAIPVFGISSTNPSNFESCDDPAEVDPANAVPRNQLAALRPANGRAMPWNPGSNAFTAGHDLTVIDRGLLYGQDRFRVNERDIGRSAFFDVGGTTLGSRCGSNRIDADLLTPRSAPRLLWCTSVAAGYATSTDRQS